jgi:hypothetical protein
MSWLGLACVATYSSHEQSFNGSTTTTDSHSVSVGLPLPEAQHITATASASWGKNTPDKAFDGNLDTCWIAGKQPLPQWIEADLNGSKQITSIKLVIEQSPNGDTTHELFISDHPMGDDVSPGVPVHIWQGHTDGTASRSIDGGVLPPQILSCDLPDGTKGQYVQVRTVASPSWVAWREIEIKTK